MIPHLIALENSGDFWVWFTDQKTYGTSFYLNAIDMELDDLSRRESIFGGFFRNIDSDWLVRIETTLLSVSGEEAYPASQEFARKADLAQLTQTQKRIALHIEVQGQSFLSELRGLFTKKEQTRSQELAWALVERLRLDFLSELSPIPWTEADINSHFRATASRAIIHNDVGLTVGTEYVGILKLTDLSKYVLESNTLGLVLQGLDFPLKTILTVTKIDKLRMNFILNQKSQQEKTGRGLVSDEKYRESEESIRDLELLGNEYFNLEMHLILLEQDKKELLKRIETAQNRLMGLGEFYHEVVGAFQSYASTLAGSPPHFQHRERLIEKDTNLSCYLPLYFEGARESISHVERVSQGVDLSSLAYHRNDGSIDFFNIYDPNFTSYSSFVVGQPGRGKSVLVNQLIRALLYNDKTSIVVLDVKGSYKRQCEFLQGKHFEIDWNQSAFINPLQFLQNLRVLNDANTIEIIYPLLQSLVLEKHQTELSSKEEHALKKLIKEYLLSKPQSPSIEDFAKFAGGFKDEEFARWIQGGIYEHVFARGLTDNSMPGTSSSSYSSRSEEPVKFKYFNVQNIAQASNKTLSSVLMSAIMAEVMMQFLIKNVEDQFVFIVDEAPFFVQHCFESFKFLVKNIRKMNGSLFLVVQSSSDLVVNGKTDLISDIPNKIIFTRDGEGSDFQNLLHLTDEEMATIESLHTENRKYAKFLLKNQYGSRVGSIVLSPQEYWRSTTHPLDLGVLERVKTAFPKAHYEALGECIVRMEEYL